MLNNFKHYQKNSIRDRYKPISKNTKTLNLYSIILKVNNSGAAKVEYLTKKKIKNIKIQLPAISMHVRLPQSLISMSIITKTIYKSVVFCAIGEVFATGCFTFNYRQRYGRKDSSVLTPALLVPDPLLSICRSEIQMTSTSLLILENAPFSNWKRLK